MCLTCVVTKSVTQNCQSMTKFVTNLFFLKGLARDPYAARVLAALGAA